MRIKKIESCIYFKKNIKNNKKDSRLIKIKKMNLELESNSKILVIKIFKNRIIVIKTSSI